MPDSYLGVYELNISKSNQLSNTDGKSKSNTPQAFVLPSLDSPAFWQAVVPEEAAKNKVDMEALAAAVRQFALRHEMEKANQVFGTIVLLYEDIAQNMARRYTYTPIGDYGNKSPQLAEELVQEMWLLLYRRLTDPDPSHQTFYLKHFFYKFKLDLQAAARQIGREEGFYTESKQPERLPSNLKASFDAPGNLNESDGGEDLSVADISPDQMAELEYQAVEMLDYLQTRLEPLEQQIIRLRLAGYSNNYIAKSLHIAEKTLKLRFSQIEVKLQDLLPPTSS